MSTENILLPVRTSKTLSKVNWLEINRRGEGEQSGRGNRVSAEKYQTKTKQKKIGKQKTSNLLNEYAINIQ